MRKIALALGLSLSLFAACGDDDTTAVVDAAVYPDAPVGIDAAPTIDAASATPDAGLGYGSITTVSFASTYIYDGARISDSTYVQTTHPGGLQSSAAFTGTYGDAASAVPPATAAGTFSFAFHSTGATPYLVVQQQSQSSTAIIAPIVVVQFATASTAVGTVDVGLIAGSDAVLYFVDPTASNCIKAVGVGTLTVTTATTTDAEGGSLSLTGSTITLYHPKTTPEGDVTSMFSASICPR